MALPRDKPVGWGRVRKGTQGVAFLPSESEIRTALKTFNWSKLQAELDSCELTDTALEEVLGHVQREEGLVFRYPDVKREGRRTELLDKFRAYVEGRLGLEAAEKVEAVRALLETAEGGYRRILKKLGECDMSKLSSETRTSASLYRAAHEYDHMDKQFHEVLKNNPGPDLFFQGPLSTGNDGRFSPDGTLEAIVGSLTNTLLMEAHKNSWFDAEHVVLPALPKVGEDELFKAGSTQLLALMWQAWRKTEQRLRYLGGLLESLTPPNLPQGAPDNAECVIVFRPTEDEFYDYIANERLCDRLTQNFMEMHTELNIRGKLATKGASAKLPPVEYVSEQEIHAAITLSNTLSYSIADDEETPGGLRLIKWLRGYAVLKQVADKPGYEAGADPDELVQYVNPVSLRDSLQECGLTVSDVDLFLSAATLHKRSRDLFDCPLIKSATGDYILFRPALLNANLAQIVLSVLSSKGEALEKKGKAFEKDLRRKLREAGLDAKGFKVKRDGEEYEYDAVLPWGDYVFIFECKNHGLSQRNPQQAYHFASTAKSDAEQVVRLADALKRYPNILAREFKEDLSEREIVPCVVNALPYARNGKLDGAYFTDASSLGRFFDQRYAHIVMHHSIDSDMQIKHRNAVHNFWSGEKPMPEDLLRHLEEPYQVEMVASHTGHRVVPFELGNDEYMVAVEYERTALSIESIASSAKVDARLVRSDIDAVATAVQQTRLEVRKPRKERSRRTRKKPNVRKKPK